MTPRTTYQHLKRWLKATAHDGMRLPLYIIMVCLLSTVPGCRIEPPLKLPSDNPHVVVTLGEVVTDLDIVWDLGIDWRTYWYYGWDNTDKELFGEIAYPIPTNFEGRFYYYGEDPNYDKWQRIDRQTIYDVRFFRSFDYGYHNMLIWSNIDSPTGSQSLIIDESDEAHVNASTSRSRVSYNLPPSRSSDVYNSPEIFYSGTLDKFYVSRDTLDYDYFDYNTNSWVLRASTELNPLVYIYLIQVVVYNNNGRIKGLTDQAVITSLADGVNLHSGHTSDRPVSMVFSMRMKPDCTAKEGQKADILGSKITTFGLCDMDPWNSSRSPLYSGSRPDLKNNLVVNYTFSNSTDSTYTYDLTEQIQRQVHGGILTIEVDADTITIPKVDPGPSPGGAGFDPTFVPPDSINHEFIM